MLYTAVKYIRDELSAHLAMTSDTADDLVVLGTTHQTDSSISAKTTDKVVVSLVNIEPAVYQGHSPVSLSSRSAAATALSAPLQLNLSILVSARFIDYQAALKNLESTAIYFQLNSEMTPQSLSSLPKGVAKLDIQLENMSIRELSDLWGMMGGKHLPCLLYKVRMITIDNPVLRAELPELSKPSVGVSL